MTVQRLTPELFAGLFEAELRRGRRPPLHFAAIGVNGAMVFGRFDPESGVAILADHSPAEGFQVPVNLIFVDNEGEADRVRLEALSFDRATFH
jgi:hypothetical protein